MHTRNDEQLEAVRTMINALTAFRNRPACISAAKHRYSMLLEGIEKYRQIKNSPAYKDVNDEFLFSGNPTAQKDFGQKIMYLEKQIEEIIKTR